MLAASIKSMNVREGNDVTTVPASFSVFRCGPDGKLDFACAYDIDAAGKTHYWITAPVSISPWGYAPVWNR